MATKDVLIKEFKPIGQGKVGTVTFELDNKSFTAKGFADMADKIGQTVTANLEKKENTYNGKTTMEDWITVPRAPRGGGGGRKPDPEQAKINRERLDLDKEKQPLIMAQCLVGKAVELAIVIAANDPKKELGTPLVQQIAIDLVEVTRNVHKEITQRF